VKEIITSAQNPKVKSVAELARDSSRRRESSLFVVEGRREIENCLKAGYGIESLYYCPEIFGSEPGYDCRQLFELGRQAYDKIAYRESTEGIVATFRTRSHTLRDLKLSANPLIVVLESVEKPGNLGAVLRSADAAGADAVIVCDPLTDIYNPNLIRSSIGAAFTVPVAVCTSSEAIAFLKERGINIYTAQLQDSEWYYNTPMSGATALVMGTESTGLTQIWRQAADAHIKIPMLGKLDSLNVSVSAAILLFEAVRQRNA